jgi:YfiH family protein
MTARTSGPRGDTPDAPAASSLTRRLAAAGLDWIVPDWAAPAEVGALSTTRSGGVSVGPAAGMNLGLAGAIRSGIDTPEAVMRNRRTLDAFLPSSPVWLEQVHGANVAVLDAASAAAARARPPVADAAVTRGHGIVCAVLTADCLPVLFADRRGRAVGIAHAGWRGLAAGVIKATVAALDNEGVPARDLCVWLGPAIGPRAFEVGPDVRDAFAAVDAGSAACFAPRGGDKWHADLCALARRALAAAGVRALGGDTECTWSDATRFYSHRRDRATGRMATLVWLQPGAVAPTL